MRRLSFLQEAERYLSRLESLRTAEELQLILQYADEIGSNNLDTVAVVAAHIKEPGIAQTLRAYVQSDLPERHLIIVYFNCSEDISAQEYDALLNEQLAQTGAAQREHPKLSLQVFAHRFSNRAPLGKIRGLIADALVVKCIEGGVVDPVVISNDADALSYRQNYMQNMRAAFDNDPLIDYASGRISWGGFDAEGNICYQPSVVLPELYFVDWISTVADDLYRELGYVFTTGCNSAFRLSALCAIGGYDYRRMPDFDVHIGYALNEYRRKFDGAKAARENARFVPECHLATNPRRTLYALMTGIPLGQQFSTCGTIPGPDLSMAEYIYAYMKQEHMIQDSDLLAFGSDEQEKCYRRITDLFRHFVNGEDYTDKGALARSIAHRTGLVIADLQQDERLITQLSFDWSKSTFPQELVRWASIQRCRAVGV